MSEFQEPEDIDELRPYMEDGEQDVEVVRRFGEHMQQREAFY